jgi:hypothetical protein
MDCGSPAVSSGRRCLIASTVAITLAPGWRCTFRMIAGCRLASAPSFTFSALSTTEATSRSRTGAPLRTVTIRLP